MREKPLKTAVLGLDESGRLLLEAVQGLDYFSIVAVADSDTKLAQQVGPALQLHPLRRLPPVNNAKPARLPVCRGTDSHLRRISQDGNKKEVSIFLKLPLWQEISARRLN